jgi:two-component system, chemotaxis family, protein-glutamate methylesterase/glutaminase
VIAAQPARPAPAGEAPVRVMLCDDSAVIRAVLARMLQSEPGIEIVARVGDGAQALAALVPGAVDVLILDIEMPVMDGLAALPELLRRDPGLRVIMASTLTTRGADIAMRALRLGAADYLPKPSAAEISASDGFRAELVAKVRGLARLRRGARPAAAAPPATRPAGRAAPRLLAIGSSTGGPQALFTLAQGLGRGLGVPLVLTQHMPPGFTALLAEHITRLGGPSCAEATDGERLRDDHIALAPGGRHLLIEPDGAGFRARLSDAPAENFCRPSVDPMLRSVTDATAGRALMVMLTGMGQDGLLGTRALVEAGGTALAQDEASSVVWGMPGAVARAGLCHAVLPLPDLAARARRLLGRPC